MQKNDVVEVWIEDMGINGEGIGKVDGYTLFIKDTVPGDMVEAKIMKAKKSYGESAMPGCKEMRRLPDSGNGI